AALPHARFPRMTRLHSRARHAYLIWGPAIAVLASYIRFAEPQRRSALVAACVASEPFPLAMHLLPYRTLTWLVTLRFGDRTRREVARALAIVLGMGLVQELAQVIGARRFGGPELFDLAVDATAAVLVLAARRRITSPSPRPSRE